MSQKGKWALNLKRRNAIIFANKIRVETVVIKYIENYVTARSCNWSCKRSFESWGVCWSWDINERVVL